MIGAALMVAALTVALCVIAGVMDLTGRPTPDKGATVVIHQERQEAAINQESDNLYPGRPTAVPATPDRGE